MTEAELDQLCVHTIRTLSIDAVQAADSGHPGTPMALAPVVYALWQRELRFDPDDPIWKFRQLDSKCPGHRKELQSKFGFAPSNIVAAARAQLARASS